MERPALPLWAKLDSGLTYCLQLLIKWVAWTLLPLLGVAAAILTWEGLFEHGEGLMELSRLEWAFIALFLLMERRLFLYNRLFGYRWWIGLWRLLSGLGSYSLAWIVFCGSAALLQLSLGGSWEAGQAGIAMTGMVQPLWLSGILLTLYLSTPTRLAEPSPVEVPTVAPTPVAREAT